MKCCEEEQITTAPGLKFGRYERATGTSCTALGNQGSAPDPLYNLGNPSMSGSRLFLRVHHQNLPQIRDGTQGRPVAHLCYSARITLLAKFPDPKLSRLNKHPGLFVCICLAESM